MLEKVDFSQEELPKEEYKAKHDELIQKLVLLQQQAHNKGVGLVVLFEGWNGAGKGSRISDLMYNLDARATSVYVTPPVDVKAARNFVGVENGVRDFYPMMQQFWQALGMRGTITFYDQGWYTTAVDRMLHTNLDVPYLKKGKGKTSSDFILDAFKALDKEGRAAVLQGSLVSVADFEKQLVADGYVVVKFFVHVSKKGQKERLTRLRKDPATAWRVTDTKMASLDDYNDAYELYDALLMGSNFGYAPWHLVNGEDKRRANITIAQTLVDALEGALNRQPNAEELAAAAKAQANSAGKLNEAPLKGRTKEQQEAVEKAAEEQAAEQHSHAPQHSRFSQNTPAPKLELVDHSLVLEQDEYKKQLKQEQKRLNELEMEMFQKRIPLIAMFEGWDAAGKGGSIKRVAQALDARAYTIFPSPAPTKPELMHPFLWRYWTRLPKAGHVGIYDRSWYGRVLVERVEGFASPSEWSRAYDEINEFERDLVRWGAILLKFWVDVSPEEQLSRFKAREEDPNKQWKITDEDWRNRDKYPQYKSAVEDMFRLTSTTHAPWVILESDNKQYARIKALRAINDALDERLHG